MNQAKPKANSYVVACGVVAIVLCILAACIGWALSSSDPNTAEEYAEEYDGNVDVYREILASNDCTYLQQQFETAYTASELNEPGTIYNHRAVGFMKASDARMKEIGCYQ